nr:hypothetical protein [Tanacetum cinerariifolium]
GYCFSKCPHSLHPITICCSYYRYGCCGWVLKRSQLVQLYPIGATIAAKPPSSSPHHATYHNHHLIIISPHPTPSPTPSSPTSPCHHLLFLTTAMHRHHHPYPTTTKGALVYYCTEMGGFGFDRQHQKGAFGFENNSYGTFGSGFKTDLARLVYTAARGCVWLFDSAPRVRLFVVFSAKGALVGCETTQGVRLAVSNTTRLRLVLFTPKGSV